MSSFAAKTVLFQLFNPAEGVNAIASLFGSNKIKEGFGVKRKKPDRTIPAPVIAELLRRRSKIPGREGTSSTLVSGQQGVSGQPAVQSRSLVGG